MVVVGVLLALWAAEWAEGRRERAAFAALREAIDDEARGNLVDLVKRHGQSQCLIAKIDDIRGRLLDRDTTWAGIEGDATFSSIAEAQRVPSFMSTFGVEIERSAFDAALEGGIARYLSAQEMEDHRQLYTWFGQYQEHFEATEAGKRVLAGLTTDLPLDDTMRVEALRALKDIDTGVMVIARYEDVADKMLELGIGNVDWVTQALDPEELRRDLVRSGTVRPCFKLPPNPLLEGEAQ